jgi:quinol monooxygenase YgiN
MPELQVIARHHVAPGHVDEALALYPKLIEASLTEPGCLGFVAYRALDDPAQVVLLERYASREAFAAHRQTPHFQDLVLGQIVPLLAGRTVEQYDAG